MTIFKHLSCAAALALAGGALSAETVLIHGEAGPNRGARADALQWFADQVAERSDGDIRFDIQWGGALFKSNAAVQSIADGVADTGSVIAVYYPQEMAGYGIADLPVNNPDAQGLDTGLIDCSQGYSYAVAALKQAEVMDSYTILDWGQVGGLGIFMNKDMHDSLTPEQQETLASVGSDMADEFGRLITEANDKAIASMKEQGVEIITLPEEDRATLVDAGKKFLDEWVQTADSTGLPGAQLLEEYQGLITKYTEARDANGYPWEAKSN